MRQTFLKLFLLPNKMSDPVVSLADIVAQRQSEASQIENEWNALSYKDRAAWWMSAKWHGYMSTDAYRRGFPLISDISNRFGEPGFFIGTRIAYFEAQPVVSQTVTSSSMTVPVPATVESTPVSVESAPASVESTPASVESVTAPTISDIISNESATQIRESVENNAAPAPAAPAAPPAPAPATATAVETAAQSAKATATVISPAIATAISNNVNSHKKKSKKHIKPTNPREGKTIEIRVGGIPK